MPKTVYVRVADNVLDDGFIAVIDTARRYGDVIVGLITDEVFSERKISPRLNFDQRHRIIRQLPGVVNVIPQSEFDCVATLRRLRPDYLFHDDEVVDENRDETLAAMGEWGGQIIAMARAGGDRLQVLNLEFGITPTMRLRQLRRQLAGSDIVRALEVHSPLCGIIAETAHAERDGQVIGFDAMWSSSLTDSTIRGKPDIELVDHSARLAGLNELFDVTTKPVLYDADTGGRPEHFAYTVRSLERLGVSAVVVEDKVGLKRNSLLGDEVVQTRESIENFCYKISAGKAAQSTKDFAVIGRVESFILNAGLEDALIRAKEYVGAGADGIMIHSRSKEPDEVFGFCERFRKLDGSTVLVVAPTCYGGVYEHELHARGVNVVIYANHLLRASYPAMARVAQTLLENGRCREADALCMSIDGVLRLIPGTA